MITGLDMMDCIWRHYDQGSQDDVGHFVGHLWEYANSTFFEGKFFHLHPTGRLEEKERAPLNILFPHEHGHTTLENLIMLWSNEGNGRYLHAS